MKLDLVHSFLNVIAPPATLVTLLLLLPPYWLAKFLRYVYRSIFSENVAGKVVIITGASSGIGEQLAYEYAKRGAHLALAARRENALREVANKALTLGCPEVIAIPTDVSKIEDCQRLIDETINKFGKLDHLVTDAGVYLVSKFEEATDLTKFRSEMDVNFWGQVYCTYFAIPHLRKSKGKIVAMASSSVWLSFPRVTVYNASKAAVMSFFETLRIEVGSDIGITIINPGVIESEITKGRFMSQEGRMELDQEMRDVEMSAIPMESAEGCAKAILKSACRGDRYLATPSWISSALPLKILCPEVLDWFNRMMFITGPKKSQREAPSKKILDLPGVKKFMYPSSVQNQEVKVD